MPNNGEFNHTKWAHELSREDAKRAHDSHYKFIDASNEAAIKAGEFALKSSMILNGGAAAATLAFIGQLVGHDNFSLHQVSVFSGGLAYFAWGVGAAAIGAGGAYITNFLTATAASTNELLWDHPWIKPTSNTKYWNAARYAFQAISILAGIAAIALFIMGVTEIRGAIGGLK